MSESPHPGDQNTLFLNQNRGLALNAQPQAPALTFFNYQRHTRG